MLQQSYHLRDFNMIFFKKSYKLCGYDVVITISGLCEDGFTKVTAESLTLMNSSDVVRMTTTGFEGFLPDG